MSKSLLITGGTGFIGSQLCPLLLSRGYTLTVLSRQSPGKVREQLGDVAVINDLSSLSGGDGFWGIINLAGAGIAEKRWSKARKQTLLESRIGLTRNLVKVAATWKYTPEVCVSGSAVGFYGDQGSKEVTEDTSPNDEFTHQMCRDWEAAAEPLAERGVRLCLSRTGLVIGKNGGFLSRMLLPFRLGLGGRIGSGEQYMPWIHMHDMVNGLIWLLETDQARGPYNLVSPAPKTNAEFTRTLADTLNRPALFPVPAFALKLALGEMAGLLLTGQKAVPARLAQQGFDFEYKDLRPALEQAVRDS